MLSAVSCLAQQVRIQTLTEEWTLNEAGNNKLYPVKVPSTVHRALFLNAAIADPFMGNNEKDLQWIGERDWEYKTRFDRIDDSRNNQVFLELTGLDTYADVYLNGKSILAADNMFRLWSVEVSDLLKSKNNELRIVFHSAERYAKSLASRQPYQLPESPRVLVRKAAFHFGWDFGPKYVTCGVWKPVNLVYVKSSRLKNAVFTTDYKDKTGFVNPAFDIYSVKDQNINVTVKVAGKEYQHPFTVKKGDNNLKMPPIEIQSPRLWWPNGHGEPYLYDMEVAMTDASGNAEKLKKKIGIRSITLINAPYSDGTETFFFRVNGIDMFMKGANYIPQNIFQDAVTPAQYEHTIQMAKDAHMNMLRVWGGGIYEDDRFYELCDQAGMLVWQDFMFANGMFPGDSDFRESVRKEAEENVTRLASHPCIALWCGNNECSEGWNRWGWQEGMDEQTKQKIWADYQFIFNNILPRAVKDIMPGTAYWESSPRFGRGDERHTKEGDAHYWGVWHDGEPYYMYGVKVPRFMSEFGFQAYPDIATIRKIAQVQDSSAINRTSPLIQNHQKHKRGEELITTYMNKDYHTPKDDQSYIYLSMVQQAEIIRYGMEAQRRKMPDCMGSLYWQLNDCWPAISWSSIDFYQHPKALYYTARRSMAPVAFVPVNEKGIFMLYIASDLHDTVSATIKVRGLDFRGKNIYQQDIQTILEPSKVKSYYSIPMKTLFNLNLPDNAYAHLELYIHDTLVQEYNNYFNKPVDIHLLKPNYKTSLVEAPGGYRLDISSNVLARAVYLWSDGGRIDFSDNFFDLNPGQVKSVLLKTDLDIRAIRDKIKYISVYDTYN